MTLMKFADALAEAVSTQMTSDERTLACGTAFLMGPGMRTDVIDRMREECAGRIIDAPIAEAAVATLGIGAALAGARPFLHFGRASFAYEALSQICSEAANVHYMSEGRQTCPLVMHMYHGLLPVESAQHCHSPQAFFWNTPGLEVVLPSTPQDVHGLFLSAFKSPNPTVILGHAKLMQVEGEVTHRDPIPFGAAEVRRRGKDISVIATSYMAHLSVEAAGVLERDGVDVEVIDPRTIAPLDKKTILQSVRKTGRVLIVDETHRSCGVAAEIAAIIAEDALDALKQPIKRLTRPDAPVIFSNELQDYCAPSTHDIVEAVKTACR